VNIRQVSPIRVVHVTSGLGRGGAEAILLDIFANAGASELDQYIISLGRPVDRRELREIDSSRVIYLGVGRRPKEIFSAIVRTRKEIKRLAPDVVHTWMYHGDIVGGIAARTLQIPVIWGLFTGSLDSLFYNRVTRLVIRSCGWLSKVIPSQIVSCSKKGIEVHRNIGYPERKMSVIPIGFDTERYSANDTRRDQFRHRYGIARSVPVVGMAARFDPQKDFRTFLEAIALVRAQMPEIIALLVGGYGIHGDNKSLDAMIEEQGLEKNILVLGFIPSIREFYNGIDLLVLSSHGEGFPRVIGEAMASGTPCVASDVGDCREVIEDAGFVITSGASKDFADAVVQFFSASEDHRQALGVRSRDRIVRNYHLSQMIAGYVEKYKECI
jgi:glycosyltransferase involved in cell wall biosynthesis